MNGRNLLKKLIVLILWKGFFKTNITHSSVNGMLVKTYTKILPCRWLLIQY